MTEMFFLSVTSNLGRFVSACFPTRNPARVDLHGQGILVISVANVPPVVLGVGTPIHNALGVVDVAVGTGSAQGDWLGGVAQVEEDEASLERGVAGLEPSGNPVVLLLVHSHVVGTPLRQPL